MAPENCHWWHELTQDERNLISDSFDCPIISIIDGMPREVQERVYYVIAPNPNLSREYNNLQGQWVRKEKELLEQRLGNLSNDSPLVTDMFERGMPFRYRLFWAAKRWLEGEYDAFGINTRATAEQVELLKNYFQDIKVACHIEGEVSRLVSAA